jgi:hypothetical protein
MLSTICVENSHFLAVGCGLNDCSYVASCFVVLVLSPPQRTVLVIVIESRQQRQTPFSTTNDSTFIEIKSQLVRIVAMLSTI